MLRHLITTITPTALGEILGMWGRLIQSTSEAIEKNFVFQFSFVILDKFTHVLFLMLFDVM